MEQDGHQPTVDGGRRLHVGLASLSAQTVSGTAAESNATLRQLVSTCVLAEEVGFDSVWLSEHHGAADGYLPSPIPVLGALSQATERVHLGTGVALGPLYEPLRLAEDLSVLDHLSGGRLLFGLGLGYRDIEYRAFGRNRAGQVAVLEQSIDLMRRWWDGPVPGGGRFGEDEPFTLVPRPFTPGGPSLLIGAFRRPGIDRAARLADGWIAPDLGSVDQLERRVAWLCAAEPVRRPFHVVLTMGMFVAARGAADLVRHGARLTAAQYRTWMVESGGHPTLEPSSDADLGMSMIVGTPDQCIGRLLPWVRALAGLPEWCNPHLTVREVYPGVDPVATRESVRLTGTEIIPRLDAEFGAAG